MRILWLTWKDVEHPLAGGAETISSEICRRLVRDGHQVIVVTSAHGSGSRSPETTAIDGYQVVRVGNRFSVYWRAYRYVSGHLSGWPDAVVEEINTIPFFSRYYMRRTPRVLLFYMLCREIWFYQLPLPFSLVGYLLEPLYLRLLNRDPTIALSQSTKQDLVRHRFRADRVSVMTAAIKLTPAHDLSASEKYDRPTIVSLGHIRPMKRTLDQIRAFELARAELPDLQLKVAGDAAGAYGRRVLRAIARSRYRADIEYLGRISETTKRELLRRSHLIVVSSIKEGWGLIVTEAASQGTPAVVYDVDGLRDSVRNRETGVITAANPRGMAAGILEVLGDRRFYERLRQQAWEWSAELTMERAYGDVAERLRSVVTR